MYNGSGYGGYGGGMYPQQPPNPYADVTRSNERDSCAGCLENTNLVRSESMDITNDPRFFSGNVIDKRLAAFAGLAIVSGLMVQNAIGSSFGMKKDFDFRTVEGWSQAIGFWILTAVLFASMLATYVGVAQPYHTYRLMTAGPAGFETAAAYYLDKNVVAWRHASVKSMLLSLPWFLVSSGFRFVSKFSRDATEAAAPPVEPPLGARVAGTLTWAIYMIFGLTLAYVHREHQHIFQAKYEAMWHGSGMGTVISEVQGMMTPRARSMTLGSVDV
jgi:hypothetical protein